MVFQEPSTALNPVFPVGWQIAEGLKAHSKISDKDARARAIEILRLVGIPDPEHRVDHYPHQFSGGQKQRIVIAQALVLDPGLIIADEPTTALDVTVQAEILDLLRRLPQEFGSAIVLITHNMGVVADLADRVAVMYNGEIVEQADVRTLFASPQHPYTQRLLDAVPRVGGRRLRDRVAGGRRARGHGRRRVGDAGRRGVRPADRLPRPAAAARVHGRRRREPGHPARRGARPGGRVGQRQDDDRPGHRRAHARSAAAR